MKIEAMKLKDIVPYDKNPRHNEEAVEAVAASIKEFGFKNPIIVDGENIIIAGHTRAKAAERLGLEEVPVIKADDLTEDQVKAFRIADNKTSEYAEWDWDLLAEEMEELDLAGFDLEITGFNSEEIEGLMNIQDEKTEVIEDDYIPEIPEDPITRPGDIWLLGKHKLLCGDSTSKEDMETLMEGEEADLIITDPPYNVAYEGQDGMTIQNDDMEDAAFYQFLAQVNKRMFENIKAGGPVYVFHADTEGENFRRAYREAGLDLKQVLVWVKNSLVLGRQDYHWRHEPILYGWKPGAAHKWYGDRDKDTILEADALPNKTKIKEMNKKQLEELVGELINTIINKEQEVPTTVIKEDKPLSNDLHPTMKPLKLVGRLMKNSSKPGDLVLDQFGGSGSTLMTAEQLGRICRTMELDEKYSDVIVNRYINLTGDRDGVFLIREGRKIPYGEIQ